MKVRCTVCREYKPKDDMFFRRQIGNACTPECLQELRGRYRSRPKKRQSKNATRDLIPRVLRKEVRERDGSLCRSCDSDEDLQVHHIDYRSQGGLHVNHNLITLCSACHHMVHGYKRYYQPLLRGLIWKQYVEEQILTLPALEQVLGVQRPEVPKVGAGRSKALFDLL